MRCELDTALTKLEAALSHEDDSKPKGPWCNPHQPKSQLQDLLYLKVRRRIVTRVLTCLSKRHIFIEKPLVLPCMFWTRSTQWLIEGDGQSDKMLKAFRCEEHRSTEEWRKENLKLIQACKALSSEEAIELERSFRRCAMKKAKTLEGRPGRPQARGEKTSIRLR